MQDASTGILTNPAVTADVLAGETGARVAPECRDQSCVYRTVTGDCALPVCKDHWQKSPERLARWALGRRAEQMVVAGADLKSVCAELSATQRRIRGARFVYAQDGDDWTLAPGARPDPYAAETLPSAAVVASCPRCGGSVLRTNTGVKCSMCARSAPIKTSRRTWSSRVGKG